MVPCSSAGSTAIAEAEHRALVAVGLAADRTPEALVLCRAGTPEDPSHQRGPASSGVVPEGAIHGTKWSPPRAALPSQTIQKGPATASSALPLMIAELKALVRKLQRTRPPPHLELPIGSWKKLRACAMSPTEPQGTAHAPATPPRRSSGPSDLLSPPKAVLLSACQVQKCVSLRRRIQEVQDELRQALKIHPTLHVTTYVDDAIILLQKPMSEALRETVPALDADLGVQKPEPIAPAPATALQPTVEDLPPSVEQFVPDWSPM
ncbi:unnamed protein product [Prorocentrum cordatum]|uniref:Uncharacterized protein n=1 Tax=Prorocentrum cordatum TaxID=2364126 RepID=A0ABN9SGK4_9DINO|nr:unnamed protein product [Polarella glacialis]